MRSQDSPDEDSQPVYEGRQPALAEPRSASVQGIARQKVGKTIFANSDTPHSFLQRLLVDFDDDADADLHPFDQLTTGRRKARSSSPRRSTASRSTTLRLPGSDISQCRNPPPASACCSECSTRSARRSSGLPSTTYRRELKGPAGRDTVPLLGLTGLPFGDIISIPFFAEPRVTPSQSMKDQSDGPNTRDIPGIGQETSRFFGCWLDFNADPSEHHFPRNPSDDGRTVRTRTTADRWIRSSISCAARISAWSRRSTSRTILSSWRHARRKRQPVAAQPRHRVVGQSRRARHAARANDDDATAVEDSVELHYDPGRPRAQRANGPAASAAVERAGNLLEDPAGRHDHRRLRAAGEGRRYPAARRLSSGRERALLRGRPHGPRVVRQRHLHPAAGCRSIASSRHCSRCSCQPGVTAGQRFRAVVQQIPAPASRCLAPSKSTCRCGIWRTSSRARSEVHGAEVHQHQDSQPATSGGPCSTATLARSKAGCAASARTRIASSPRRMSARAGRTTTPARIRPPAGWCSSCYDCAGAFEGFVLEDCDKRHRFGACEPGLERVIRQACESRARVSVLTRRGAERPVKVIVHCC